MSRTVAEQEALFDALHWAELRWNQWADSLAVGQDAIRVNFGAAGRRQALVPGAQIRGALLVGMARLALCPQTDGQSVIPQNREESTRRAPFRRRFGG